MPCVVGNLLLTHGDDRLFCRHNVVAIHAASLHQVQRFALSFQRDRIRSLDVTSDIGTVCDSVVFGVVEKES
jgi:hypothetical protein